MGTRSTLFSEHNRRRVRGYNNNNKVHGLWDVGTGRTTNTHTLQLIESSSATRGAHPECFYSAFLLASAMTALPTTLCFAVCEQQSRLAKQVRGLG